MKISAIVPVYNSENYVGRCIESVLSQTYQDWELILVDDGSIDKSLKILKDYEKKDCRIKVIHQENKGPGIARNTGIKQALGEYIVFIDSDDVITKDYFELLSQKTEDVVFIDINQVDEEFKVICREYMSDKIGITKDELLRSQMTGKINWGGVRKSVKRDLLERYHIRYSDHRIGEEAIFSFFILYYATSFSFIEKPVYTYINREGSQSDFKIDDPWGNVAELLKKEIKIINKYSVYANTINTFFITAELVALDRIAKNYSFLQYFQKSKKVIKSYRKKIDKEYGIDYKNMLLKVKVIYFFVEHEMPLIIYLASKIKNKLKRK